VIQRAFRLARRVHGAIAGGGAAVAPTRSIHLALGAALLLFFLAPAARAETVIVQRRTRVLEHPADDAEMIMRVKKDRPAKVIKRKSDWVKVKIAGEVGWVPTSQIEQERDDEEAVDQDEVEAAEDEDAGEQVADADEPESDDEEVARVDDRPAKKKAAAPSAPRFAAYAALGLRTMSSSFTSDGAMELGNYRLSARSYSAGFAFDVVAYRRDQLSGVLDARYQGSVGSPGVQFSTGEAGTGYVPFTTHDIDVGGRVGWTFAGWVRASGRLGYHADVLHVEKVDNVGKMPSEVLRGYTVGAAVEAPFHGSGWSGRAAIDTLVSGKRKQTVGLEDGAPGAAKASWITLAIGYALSEKLCAELGYRRASWTSTWSGTSAREADITTASRKDSAQLVSLGLSQSF
jgi:hypothetical protein